MSFYDNNNTWSGPARDQTSWEKPQQQPQQASTSRSGSTSAMSYQPEPNAFAAQFEEIERATDNLMRSGKWGPGALSGMQMLGRRDSASTSSRGFDHAGGDHRPGPRHHQSNSDFDVNRPGSAGLQNYYAGQRFPPRQSEAEQMLQAKRRMAAQRERELRNYHQEQQYNRTSSSAKSDRSMSPNTMSEEDRRELIARQHRALYGDGSNLYMSEGSTGRHQSQDISGRGTLPFDSYGNQAQPGADSAVQMPPRDRAESTASPVANVASQQSLAEGQQHHARPSTTSPAASPPLQSGSKAGNNSVAPIGTRPSQTAGPVGGLNKRSTTPLTASSLSYGYTGSEKQHNNDERSTSTASNPQTGDKPANPLGASAWGNNGGPWNKNSLSNQASVWG